MLAVIQFSSDYNFLICEHIAKVEALKTVCKGVEEHGWLNWDFEIWVSMESWL